MIVKRLNGYGKIYQIRGEYVLMSDDINILFDVALSEIEDVMAIYESTFPGDLVFEPDTWELEILNSQGYLSQKIQGSDGKPAGSSSGIRAFTEEGILMFALLLNTQCASNISIRIVDYFTLIREQASEYRG